MTKLTKAQEKRFDERWITETNFQFNPDEIKQHLANELAREREKAEKRGFKKGVHVGMRGSFNYD